MSVGPLGSLGFFSQTLATTPGATYQLDYWLANFFAGSGTNVFQVSWDGNLIAGAALLNPNAFVFTQFSFSGLVATSTSTTLSFGFQNDRNYWGFDDVGVVQTSGASTPDGGTTAVLLGLALVALAGMRRRLG